MGKIRVLWLSNIPLRGPDARGSGSWLAPLAKSLVASGRIELGNVAPDRVRSVVRADDLGVVQWIIPRGHRFPGRSPLPGPGRRKEILGLIDEFSPDMVHVWGTEEFWGLLVSRRIVRLPALLEMQGLKQALAPYYEGGLSWKEQLACLGLKEMAKLSPLFRQRNAFRRWGVFEQEIIRGHKFIGIQSAWIGAWVRSINPDGVTFHNDIVLRDPFYIAGGDARSRNHVLFCSAAYAVPHKGLHVAIRAAALLKDRFPALQLRIAGPHQRKGVRQDGYVRWLNREVKRLGLTRHVAWLGQLSAAQIIEEMAAAAAMIIPSYIENCCVSMQEAMQIGVPLVVSCCGGLPSLADHERSALFFPAGDPVTCACQVERLFTDRSLADRLSHGARARALERNDPERIRERQISIYEQVLADNNPSGAPVPKISNPPRHS